MTRFSSRFLMNWTLSPELRLYLHPRQDLQGGHTEDWIGPISTDSKLVSRAIPVHSKLMMSWTAQQKVHRSKWSRVDPLTPLGPSKERPGWA